MYRDHNCGELNINDVNKNVKLAGWVQRVRNLGSMLFIDLRDQYGITQIVITDEKLKEQMDEIPSESVISVIGNVRERSNKNNKIPTGEIEIDAKEIEVLGKCKNVLPFEINSEKVDISNVKEDLRLQYRYYALPQAPQQFKQLLMVSGFDKYYQIAPCFRDEDPRADRAPGEFYQLDMEMSFATQEDVFAVIEKVIPKVFEENSNYEVTKGPFIRIPYSEAMEKYGIDKPDLRNPLVINDATKLFENTEFNAFKGKTIKYIKVPNGNNQGRKFFDSMGEFAINECEAKGLAWFKSDEQNNLTGGISKFITEDIKNGLDVKPNDAYFFVADEFKKAQKIAGLVRIELGKRLDLIEKNVFKFCWINDFPMYEYNDDEQKVDFNHNPFSMPQGGMEALNNKDPLEILAYQYDLVCNGYELASGAVRNHNPEIMVKAFEIAGYTEDDVKKKFGALYTAFQYGTPPHAGIAPGLDRMVMLIAGTDNIREVIAFPKNKKARDVMMNAPWTVTEKQLKDVHIAITEYEDNDDNE